MRKVTISLIQMQSSSDMDGNLDYLQTSVTDAAAQGAQIIITPENLAYMPMNETTPAFIETEHPAISAGKKLARRHGVYLLLGSLLIQDGLKKYNRSIFIDPAGEILIRYDKIHLFDVQLSASEQHGESRYFSAGDKAVLLETKFGKFGFTICYDLRFPQLFHALASRGAECIFVPAAFTRTTGELGHWETLLRARAIENRCFISGAGQCGAHGEKSHTYGHSMAVDPDGKVIAKAANLPCILASTIDLDEVPAARSSIPCLQNSRPFNVAEIKTV